MEEGFMPQRVINGCIPILHPQAPTPDGKEREYNESNPTMEEREELEKFVPKDEPGARSSGPKPQLIQLMFRASIRYHDRTFTRSLVAVTPHFLVCIGQDEKEEIWKEICTIHVLEIKKLYYGTNFSVIPFCTVRLFSIYKGAKKIKPKITINARTELNLHFTLVLYRNMMLAYSTAYCDEELKPTLKSKFPEAVPPLDLALSLGQQFQYSYYALCSRDGVPYNHQVVQYFNYNMVNFNGLLDLGYVPLEFSNELSVQLEDMMSIFRALIHFPYVFGVICTNFERADIAEAAALQMMVSQNIRILHFSGCGIKTGLKALGESLGENPTCPLEYLDLSNNKIEDFDKFFKKAFTDRTTNLFYLNVNHTGMSESVLCDLFAVARRNECLHELKYLHVAGSQFTATAKSNFVKYLEVTEVDAEDGGIPYGKLKSIDLGDIQTDVNSILSVLVDHRQPLMNLMLYNTLINKSGFADLCTLVKETRTLSYIDVSNTRLTAVQVSELVFIMSELERPNVLTLKLGNLNLNGENLMTVVKAFMNSQLNKWKCIWLDSNGLKPKDLDILVGLFHSMPNLEELSLTNNFDVDMPEIEASLIELLRVPRLKRLRIGGGADHHLGWRVRTIFFAAGLSYVARTLIGGLSTGETLAELEEYKMKAAQAMLPVFSAHGPADARDFIPTLIHNGLEDVLVKMLIDEKTRRSRAKITADMEATRGKLKCLIPLIKSTTNIPGSDKATSKAKSIGTFVTDLVNKLSALAKSNKYEHQVVQLLVDNIDSIITLFADCCQLEEIDVKNNRIEDVGVEAAGELIKLNKELMGIDLDGCGCNQLSTIDKLVDIICEQKHITRLFFPVNDGKEMVRKAQPRAKTLISVRIREQRLRMARQVYRNRAERGELADLPLDICPDLEDIIVKYTHDMERYLDPSTVATHSGIFEDFELQLPYLDEEDPIPDDYNTVDIGKTRAYLAPGMEKRYKEFEEDFVPLQLLAIKRRRTRFLLPESDTETEEETDEPAPAESVALEELEEYMPSTAAMVEADEYSTHNTSYSDSSDSLDNAQPENDDQVEVDEAPAFNPDDTDVPVPDLYKGKIEEMSLTQSESESACVRRLNRKFGNLKKTFTRVDLSSVENTVSITRPTFLQPPT